MNSAESGECVYFLNTRTCLIFFKWRMCLLFKLFYSNIKCQIKNPVTPLKCNRLAWNLNSDSTFHADINTQTFFHISKNKISKNKKHLLNHICIWNSILKYNENLSFLKHSPSASQNSPSASQGKMLLNKVCNDLKVWKAYIILITDLP